MDYLEKMIKGHAINAIGQIFYNLLNMIDSYESYLTLKARILNNYPKSSINQKQSYKGLKMDIFVRKNDQIWQFFGTKMLTFRNFGLNMLVWF